MRKITFWKTLTITLCLFFGMPILRAQTVLSPGDIVIVNVNSDEPKYFDFVPLVDLSVGTVINFTDNAWTGSALNTNEGTKTYTASALVTKGTVVSFNGATDGDWTSSGNFNFSTSGDNLLVYQGLDTAPTFIYGIGWANGTTWINTGTVDSNNSYIPTNLSVASNTIVSLGSSDNYKYDIAKGASGTNLQLLALIANSDNWIGNNDTAYPAISGSFSVNTSPTIIVDKATFPTFKVQAGQNIAQSINVSGANLTDNITMTISGTDAALFELNINVVPQTAGTAISTEVTVKYTPISSGNHSATLTLSSPGADDVIRTLTGYATTAGALPDVIITEVYGGGGNSGATYQNDFVELYNTSESSIDISGWSVQYYTSAGTSADVIAIPSGKSIAGKGYFLLAGKSTAAVGDLLPTPDVTNGLVNLSGADGKVVLYSIATEQALTSTDLGSITDNANFVDYVTYGSATPVWGSALGSLSSTTSASRILTAGNYAYTKNIGVDFERITPNPRNSGFTTSNSTLKAVAIPISVSKGSIKFSATAGELVVVYNAIGQKLVSKTAVEGVNTIAVPTRGVVLVKVGAIISKVIM